MKKGDGMKTRIYFSGLRLVLLVVLGTLSTARAYHDPGVQRWINRDPIGNLGGVNLYGYVDNNPVSLYDPDGLLPPSNPSCKALQKKIENLEKEVAKRRGQLHEDPQGLPESAPGDDKKPSLSRRGHRKILNMIKENLAAKKALYRATCSDPEQPVKKCFLDACESIPGTPQQLETAGEIADNVAVITQAVIAGLETGGAGGRPLTVPSGRPVPRPVPATSPGIFPVPAYP